MPSAFADTVFSHPRSWTVLLIPEGLAVERVRRRVGHGGHDVPEGKIRERHRRAWHLVPEAIEIADTTTVYGNSRLDGPRIVAQLTAGTVIGAPTWPAWESEALLRRWRRWEPILRRPPVMYRRSCARSISRSSSSSRRLK